MALSFLRGSVRRTAFPVVSIGPRRHAGYLVLIPEIGEEVTDKDPLLRADGLPEFNDITIEKCIAVIGNQALNFESGINIIENKAAQCKNFFTEILEPIQELENPLEWTWGIAKTLYLGNSSLMPTKSYLNIHERAQKARTSKFHSLPIYRAVLTEIERYKTLDDEKQRVLNKFALEGKLNGLDLVPKSIARERYVCLLHELQDHRTRFRDKIEYANKIFSHTIENEEIVREFPESLLKAMAADSSDAGRGPWKVTLQPHVYDAFMQYCPSRQLRWNVLQAYNSRGSGYGERQFETSSHLEIIRDCRHKQAKHLGFENFVDMSMETKMAQSKENVYSVLNHLLEKARPMQNQELESLQSFSNDRGFSEKLEFWDIPYWQRKQRRSLFHYDEEKIREYFPLPRVLNSLFNLCATLFKINIVERSNVQTWHKDVKFYDIFDESSNRPVAGFYLDPYAREDEKIRVHDDAGWHVAISNRCAALQKMPLSALIFNFQVPMYGKQSLLSFQEVNVLFQKFGHALRHLLTRANYSEVAGISNVEWDAAEVCGYVLTHWLYDPSTVRGISGHYASDEPLPDEVIENLKNVRGHMAGYTLCRELYLSTLDLELHSSTDFWKVIVKRLWPDYHTLPLDKYDSHPCSFTKIVSGEWAAAYYCHLWSRMIAADVYSAFEEAQEKESGVVEVGERYRNTFLALGGSCHPAEVFRRFRGRDPSPNALLHNLRLDQTPVD